MTRLAPVPSTLGEALAERIADAIDGTLLDHPGAFVDASADGTDIGITVSFEYDDPDAPAEPSRHYLVRVIAR